MSADKVSVVRQLMELQTSYASLLQKQKIVLKENNELKQECTNLREKYH